MSKKHTVPYHEKVILGVEIEGYTILVPKHEISRKMAFHRRGVVEKGERFTRDWSIGTEYNSRPFTTIREGLFLLKTGLRKYNTSLYRSKGKSRNARQIFLVGGWRDRFAGTHIHVSIAGRKLNVKEAQALSTHVHDHLPLLIALGANSPVWSDEITEVASNRVMKGSKAYFKPTVRGKLTKKDLDEMTYNRPRKTKPGTLEVRVMDSNLPEFILATACIVKACALAWMRRKKAANKISHFQYLRSRQEAAKHGMAAKLCWNGEWLRVPDYLDRFVWTFRQELKEMDIPHDVWMTLKLLKKGFNGSRILHDTTLRDYRHHPQTWQKRFAKRYVRAIGYILAGNSMLNYMKTLNVSTPSLSNVWLGRKRLKLL